MGSLNGPEANLPDKQQEQVTKIEDKAKPAPVMTEEQKKEWAKIGPPKSRTSALTKAGSMSAQGGISNC